MAKNTLIRETDFTPFDDFGGYYKIDEYELCYCPMLANGEMEEEDYICAVEYLEQNDVEEKFLEKINKEFGSDFKYSQFNIWE